MVADEHTLRSHLFEQLAEPFSAQELFDCLPDVVFFIKNAQCQYVVVNHTLVERCGRPSKAHLLGRRADEVFPAPLGESYRTQDEEVIRAGSAIRDRLELHFYPTGRCGWCLTNKLPLRGSSGQTVGLVGVSKDLQTANEKGQDYARIADAVTRIRNGYDQPLQVSELAAAAGLSVYQFEQRIRRIFHMTAGHLIHKVRMEAAVALLLQSQESIAAIASKCGYSDQSAFTRKFRETIGLSPLQYRNAFRVTCST
ncbi:MAG TPA: AraC family transcriptional regulator [Casimicrobiaceae bacterium]|nr:AraC family transcriptional regulator [Casimicrobiaceae bacterium]